MIRCIFTVFITCIFTSTFAQSSDFIQLKKRNKVLQSWFKDNDIYVQLKNKQWITATIYKIKDDSLYLRPYQIIYYTRGLGINAVDTVYYGTTAVHIHAINAFPKDMEGFGYVKDGSIFKIGGGGYLLLNIINSLSKNEPLFSDNNATRISIAAGVIALGVVLGLTHKDTYIIGRKYHIEYISVKPSS